MRGPVMAEGSNLKLNPTPILEETAYQSLVSDALGVDVDPVGGWLLPTALPQREQGWKIHISATIVSAAEVLKRTLPILRARTAAFKVSATPGCLADLNAGAGGYSQVGKFITVYPESDEAAIAFAKELDEATTGLPGPRVPSDRQLHAESLISYRYGGFSDLHLTDDLGQFVPAIRGPDGTLMPDQRGPEFKSPDWVEDPFINSGLVEEKPPSDLPLFSGHLILSALRQSAKGGVYFALDPSVSPPRTCVLKEARAHLATDVSGDDIRVQLKKQYDLLLSLRGSFIGPSAYAFFEKEDNRYLVMEHVEGDTLEDLVTQGQGEGLTLDVQVLVDIGTRIAASLGQFHQLGWVFRDMTPSNVMIGVERVYLLDFELAHRVDDEASAYGWGTPGYTSPQQAARCPPAITDDVFGLGATLFFALTGSDPAYVVGGVEERTKALRLIRPTIEPALAQLVARMMDHDSARRPPSMEAVITELQTVVIASSPLRIVPDDQVTDDSGRASRYLEKARLAGDSLLAEAELAPGGVRWASRAMNFQKEVGAMHLPRKTTYTSDLHNGVSGIGLYLVRLAEATSERRYVEAAELAAGWLLHTSTPRSSLPGLHFGRAGVALFLAELSVATAESVYRTQASSIARALTPNSTSIPDLTHGLAGIGLVHLYLAHGGDDTHLALACNIGDQLLGEAEEFRGGIAWRHPPGPHGGLSGEMLLGLAHGSAGIAYFLLRLWEATGSEKYLAAAIDATVVLSTSTVPCLDDKTGVNWPVSVTTDEPDTTWFYWCHGASGIGLFFLESWRVTGDEDHRRIAEAAAHTVARTGRRGGGVLCHGLAGNGAFLLKAYQALAEAKYRTAAFKIADLLELYVRRTEDGVAWPSEQPGVITPDYMVGYSGTGAFFLMAADPEANGHTLRIPPL